MVAVMKYSHVIKLTSRLLSPLLHLKRIVHEFIIQRHFRPHGLEQQRLGQARVLLCFHNRHALKKRKKFTVTFTYISFAEMLIQNYVGTEITLGTVTNE